MTLKQLLDKCYFEIYIVNAVGYSCDYNPVLVTKDKDFISSKLIDSEVKEISYQEGAEEGSIMIDVYVEEE